MSHEQTEIKWPNNKNEKKKIVNGNDKKKWFRIPPSIVIIIFILLFVIFLSWILQGQSVTSQFGDSGSLEYIVQPIGLLSIGNIVIDGFADASGIIFYLFTLGWFLNILLESGTLEEGVKALIRGTKNREIILVPLMFLLFAFGGTAFGLQEETLGLFIIIIPFFILAGFDNVTGLLVVLLGTTTGLAASVVDPFSVASAYDAIPDTVGSGSYTLGDGILFRALMFVIFVTIGTVFVTTYAYRVKKNPNKSLTFSNYEENVKWANDNMKSDEIHSSTIDRKSRNGLIVFVITFIVMFLFLIPWASFFNMDELWSSDPADLPSWISWLVAGMAPFGSWGFGELTMLFAISSIILSFGVYKMKTTEVVESFFKGAKDMLAVSILIAIARAIPFALAQSTLDYYIALSIANQLSDIGQLGWTYSLFFIFGAFAFFIPSTSGLASATMGIFAGSANAIFSPEMIDQVIISTVVVYIAAVGIVNMLTPTQAVVMASAEQSRVPFKTMLKPVGMYAGILTIAMLIIVIPATTLI